MKNRHLLLMAIVFFACFILIAPCGFAGDWESSPDNWDNSENNWENSSSNWDNSPSNYSNSTEKFGNDRIVYDEDGEAAGYAVPKESGGVNIYDFNGNRKGYTPASDGDSDEE